jgi:NAD(P)-dependent dehydrogenase (short-subunit alcohol dehydrogenase family)
MANAPITLITGSYKGIGYEAGRQLAAKGHTVILSARDGAKAKASAEKLRADGSSNVHSVQLDVADQASVREAVKQIGDQFGRLDVLVNNAGINPEFRAGTAPQNLDLATLKKVFDSNVFGPFDLTQQCVPLLKKSSSARVINVSSILGSLAALTDPKHPYYGINVLAYNSSKTALNSLTISLSKALAESKIAVNSINPGWVQSDMGGPQAPKTLAQGARIIVELATAAKPYTGQFVDDDGIVAW